MHRFCTKILPSLILPEAKVPGLLARLGPVHELCFGLQAMSESRHRTLYEHRLVVPYVTQGLWGASPGTPTSRRVYEDGQGFSGGGLCSSAAGAIPKTRPVIPRLSGPRR